MALAILSSKVSIVSFSSENPRNSKSAWMRCPRGLLKCLDEMSWGLLQGASSPAGASDAVQLGPFFTCAGHRLKPRAFCPCFLSPPPSHFQLHVDVLRCPARTCSGCEPVVRFIGRC